MDSEGEVVLGFFANSHFIWTMDLKKTLWAIIAVLVVINLGLVIFFESAAKAPAAGEAVTEEMEQQRQQFGRLSFWKQLIGNGPGDPQYAWQNSRYDGLRIDGDQQEAVISVMIDNFSLARPQHEGIRRASIVYEVLVEGGITRLMLLFPYQDIDRVGPIRSARDYFVDLAEEYGGIHIHAGGSPMALEQLASSQRLYQLDEDDRDGGESYSWRDTRYAAPHNLFLDVNAVRDFAADHSWRLEPSRQAFCFTDEALDGPEATQVELDFSHDRSSSSFVFFQYQDDQQVYQRYYGASQHTPHLDQGDGMQVAPVNVVVQIAPSRLISGDEKERLALQHIGQGKAFFFRGGKVLEGRWSKSAEDQPTVFRDLTGGEVCLSTGQSWIALLDGEELLSFQE